MRVWVMFLLVLTAAPAFAVEEIATLADLIGAVTVERNGKPYRVTVGFPLYQGDVVRTGKDGKARLLMKDNSVLSIGPSSQLKLTEMKLDTSSRLFSLNVLAGRFKMDVARWFKGATNGRIETPSAVAGVRGTVVWGDVDLDAVCALEGTLTLESKNGGKPRELKAIEKGDERKVDCGTGMKDGKTDPLQPKTEDLLKFLEQVSIP